MPNQLQTPDDELLRLFVDDGSEEAFRELFDRYYTALVVFADKTLQDEDAAADVVQNLFVSLYEKRETLNAKSVRTFLFGSVRNASLNVLKHQKVVHAFEAAVTQDTGENFAESADALVEQAEAEARIGTALASLPEQCRRIFEMSRMDGLTNQEIADQLDISKRTVETQISNALRLLRQMLLTYVGPTTGIIIGLAGKMLAMAL